MSAVKDFFQNVGSALTFGLIPPAKPHVDEISEEDINNILLNASSIVEQSFDIEKIGSEVSSITSSILEDSFVNPQNTSPPPALPTYPCSSKNPVNPYN